MKNLYKIENELYIVDNTEEINKDTKTCWCIDISCNELVLHQGVLPSYHYKHYKKIIMTTDKSINVLCSCGKDCGAKESGVQKIDDEFLEWFVKNPSCEEVKLDSICKCTSCGSFVKSSCDYAYKCNPQIFYKIIIPKEEVKYPIGGYAPGYYGCTCVTCKTEFMGDKRAVQCEPCAVSMTKEEPKDVVLGYKTSLDAQMLDKIGLEEPKQETLEESNQTTAIRFLEWYRLKRVFFQFHSYHIPNMSDKNWETTVFSGENSYLNASQLFKIFKKENYE